MHCLSLLRDGRTSEEEIEFNIDALSANAFHDIFKVVSGMLPEAKKKRKSSTASTGTNGLANTIKKKAKVAPG